MKSKFKPISKNKPKSKHIKSGVKKTSVLEYSNSGVKKPGSSDYSKSGIKNTSSPEYIKSGEIKAKSAERNRFLPAGLMKQEKVLSPAEYSQWLAWLKSLHPIWESRYQDPAEDRKLLRPVYWMGNWQFACLGYYQLPHGTQNRCVRAEVFPDFVQNKIDQVEMQIKASVPAAFVPRKWKLNTLLINYYGSILENEKKVDQARLGEHKDHEPGPVASFSFGAKTMFQFVNSAHRQAASQVVYQQWLEDNSLFVFSGDKFKNRLFHRVQRVDRKSPVNLDCKIANYETRRINLTFRYVPEEHWVDYVDLPEKLKTEIAPYVDELAQHSAFFANIKTQV